MGVARQGCHIDAVDKNSNQEERGREALLFSASPIIHLIKYLATGDRTQLLSDGGYVWH